MALQSTLSHKPTHATGGADALSPADIGARPIFVNEQLNVLTTDQIELAAGRAKVFTVVQYAGGVVNVRLPSTGVMAGDEFVFQWGTGSNSINIWGPVSGGNSQYFVIATLSSGQQKRFQGSAFGVWSLVPVDAHKATHATGGADALTPADIGAIGKNISDSSPVNTIRAISAAQYDALGLPDSNTIYFIL
jgi:hypothetical protein